MIEEMKLNTTGGWTWPNKATEQLAEALNEMDFEETVVSIIREHVGRPEDLVEQRIYDAIVDALDAEYERLLRIAGPLTVLMIQDPSDIGANINRIPFAYLYAYDLWDDPEAASRNRKAPAKKTSKPKRSANARPKARAPAKKTASRRR